ncbi:FAD-dependent oxidoreductase [Salinactinospora qingdaonensis]|uniref:FAD-dependent monooxygenase n=1 Tax=Salinactinospora qingdaonensis TaxID=702744 RepID=A0ABP7F2S1_9ACTN
MRVLIVGAGLAGMSLYRLLRQDGHEVRLADRAPRFDRRGYGIVLWSNAWQVLERAGAAESAAAAGVAVHHWEVRDADGRRLRSFSPQRTWADPSVGSAARRPFTVIHRADLHEALREGVPAEAVRLDTTLRDVRQDATGVTVTWSDGEKERADVLVGADGVHSQVREIVFGRSSRDLGTAAWAFWVPTTVDMTDGFTELWGKDGKAVLIGGITGHRMATVAAPSPPGLIPDNPLGHLREITNEWGLSDILRAVAAEGGDVFFDRNREVRLSGFDAGRVVLVGDAAHALHPIVGMGASLALEDAWVLADQLRGGLTPDASHSELAGFTRRRRAPIRRFMREAALMQRLILTGNPLVGALRNALVRTPILERFFAQQNATLSRDLAERL